MVRSFNHRELSSQSLSPADRVYYFRWMRCVAAVYGSVALLTFISVAALHHRSNGPETQIVNLQLPQVN